MLENFLKAFLLLFIRGYKLTTLNTIRLDACCPLTFGWPHPPWGPRAGATWTLPRRDSWSRQGVAAGNNTPPCQLPKLASSR